MEPAEELRDRPFRPKGRLCSRGVGGPEPEDGWTRAHARVIPSQFQTRVSGSFPVLDAGRASSPGQTGTTSPPAAREPGVTGLRTEQQGQGLLSQQG